MFFLYSIPAIDKILDNQNVMEKVTLLIKRSHPYAHWFTCNTFPMYRTGLLLHCFSHTNKRHAFTQTFCVVQARYRFSMNTHKPKTLVFPELCFFGCHDCRHSLLSFTFSPPHAHAHAHAHAHMFSQEQQHCIDPHSLPGGLKS